MKAFQLTVDHRLKLLVIPDVDAHVDGHPILTYSYNIYKDSDLDETKENKLHLTRNDDPTFMGTIIFEQPGKLFRYEPGDYEALNSGEVEETIEQITHYRDTPAMWML